MKKVHTRIRYVIMSLFILMIYWDANVKFGDFAKEPDVINSININRNHYLTVVANCSEIENKEEFAWKLIEMCRDNSFHSIKLSTDRGYVSGINMKVYLRKKDINRHEPEMLVKYEAIEYDRGYDIVNNPEQFELFIDGRLVDY